jgi:hypothetical protein
MATLILPARSDAAFYDFEVDLDERAFTIEIRWNARAGGWFLSLYDSAGVPLSMGRRIVLGANLLGHGVDPALPPGTLLAVDTTTQDSDPGRDDLGSRVLLAYVEATA